MHDDQSYSYIEAANEVSNALGELDLLILETKELERCLASQESKLGIVPDRAKPITQRMAAFGASREDIDSVAKKLEVIALRFNS